MGITRSNQPDQLEVDRVSGGLIFRNIDCQHHIFAKMAVSLVLAALALATYAEGMNAFMTMFMIFQPS